MRVAFLSSSVALTLAAAAAAEPTAAAGSRMLIASPDRFVRRHLQAAGGLGLDSGTWQMACPVLIGSIESEIQEEGLGSFSCECGDLSFSCGGQNVCDPESGECFNINFEVDMGTGETNMCIEEVAGDQNEACFDITLDLTTSVPTPKDCDISFNGDSCTDCSFEGECMAIDCSNLFGPEAKANSCDEGGDFTGGMTSMKAGGAGDSDGGDDGGEGILATTRVMKLAENADNSAGATLAKSLYAATTASVAVLAFVAI